MTIANAETGSRRASQTDSRGGYILKAPPGTYRVSVDLVGFVGEARSDVTLRAAQPQELDFRLRLAGTESSQALRP